MTKRNGKHLRLVPKRQQVSAASQLDPDLRAALAATSRRDLEEAYAMAILSGRRMEAQSQQLLAEVQLRNKLLAALVRRYDRTVIDGADNLLVSGSLEAPAYETLRLPPQFRVLIEANEETKGARVIVRRAESPADDAPAAQDASGA